MTFIKGLYLNVYKTYWTEHISCSIAIIEDLVVFSSNCTLILGMFSEFPLNQLKVNHVKLFTSLYCNVSLLCWVHFWVSVWNNFAMFLLIRKGHNFFFSIWVWGFFTCTHLYSCLVKWDLFFSCSSKKCMCSRNKHCCFLSVDKMRSSSMLY